MRNPIAGRQYRYPFREAEEATKVAVWNKGRPIDGYDPWMWRHDQCGAVMKYDEHGQTTKYGWEIDHIVPQSNGGSDKLENLQPLQWQNNRRKGDQYPWSC